MKTHVLKFYIIFLNQIDYFKLVEHQIEYFSFHVLVFDYYKIFNLKLNYFLRNLL